jgi:hypothetical protein
MTSGSSNFFKIFSKLESMPTSCDTCEFLQLQVEALEKEVLEKQLFVDKMDVSQQLTNVPCSNCTKELLPFPSTYLKTQQPNTLNNHLEEHACSLAANMTRNLFHPASITHNQETLGDNPPCIYINNHPECATNPVYNNVLNFTDKYESIKPNKVDVSSMSPYTISKKLSCSHDPANPHMVLPRLTPNLERQPF